MEREKSREGEVALSVNASACPAVDKPFACFGFARIHPFWQTMQFGKEKPTSPALGDFPTILIG